MSLRTTSYDATTRLCFFTWCCSLTTKRGLRNSLVQNLPTSSTQWPVSVGGHRTREGSGLLSGALRPGTHLLVLPELGLDGDGDLVVLQFPAVEQLLQEVAFSGLLADQVGGHGGGVRDAGLAEERGKREGTDDEGLGTENRRLYGETVPLNTWSQEKPEPTSVPGLASVTGGGAYLEGQQADERGEALRGHEADAVAGVAHAAEHRHHEQHDVGHDVHVQLLHHAWDASQGRYCEEGGGGGGQTRQRHVSNVRWIQANASMAPSCLVQSAMAASQGSTRSRKLLMVSSVAILLSTPTQRAAMWRTAVYGCCRQVNRWGRGLSSAAMAPAITSSTCSELTSSCAAASPRSSCSCLSGAANGHAGVRGRNIGERQKA
ncbi:hypothetical protein EYF80_052234 [Liparis tanakae]|uniref:Uncharacterized protein n=1 Tax=Liparis tanakae TaxID=230148 RepID=A0A4Z2F9R3_9TELE|nr:hypothetical protein EYF80_052234 [Liparis tanakae]